MKIKGIRCRGVRCLTAEPAISGVIRRRPIQGFVSPASTLVRQPNAELLPGMANAGSNTARIAERVVA